MLHSTVKYNKNTQTEQTGSYDTEFLSALSAFGNQIMCRIYANNAIAYEGNDIRYVKRYGVVNMLKSIMYAAEIRINDLIDMKGTVLSDVQFGVSIDGTNYYMISFGRFTVTDSPMDIAGEYTTLTAYDGMLPAMKQYEKITVSSNTTLYSFLTSVATALGLTVGASISNTGIMLKTFANTAPYSDKNTYRDILDDYSELLGGCICVKNGKLELLGPNVTNKTLDESNLSTFTPSNEYGLVQNVLISRDGIEGVTAYNSQTSGSIINIVNNRLINYSMGTQDFLEWMYNAYREWGSYYPIEAESYGYMLFEPMDIVTFNIRESTYRTIWLSSDISIAQGKSESVSIPEPIDSANDYFKSDDIKVSLVKVVDQVQDMAPTIDVSKDGSTTTITVTNSDGSSSVSTITDGADGADGADGIDGTNGEDGEDGRSVVSIVKQYYLSTSASTTTGGSWGYDIPVYISGRYYWYRDEIEWANPTEITHSPAVLDNGLNNAISNASTAQTIAQNAIIQTIPQYCLSESDQTPGANPTWYDGKFTGIVTGEGGDSDELIYDGTKFIWERFKYVRTNSTDYSAAILSSLNEAFKSSVENSAWIDQHDDVIDLNASKTTKLSEIFGLVEKEDSETGEFIGYEEAEYDPTNPDASKPIWTRIAEMEQKASLIVDSDAIKGIVSKKIIEYDTGIDPDSEEYDPTNPPTGIKERMESMEAQLTTEGFEVKKNDQSTKTRINEEGLQVLDANGNVICRFINDSSEVDYLDVRRYLLLGAHRAQEMSKREFSEASSYTTQTIDGQTVYVPDGISSVGTGFMFTGGHADGNS